PGKQPEVFEEAEAGENIFSVEEQNSPDRTRKGASKSISSTGRTGTGGLRTALTTRVRREGQN
ncbi:unnamed protein product, partial [Coccothraustes coccothraustes]